MGHVLALGSGEGHPQDTTPTRSAPDRKRAIIERLSPLWRDRRLVNVGAPELDLQDYALAQSVLLVGDAPKPGILGQGLQQLRGSFRRLPLKSKRADALLTHDMSELLSGSDALQEVMRVLSEDGAFVCWMTKAREHAEAPRALLTVQKTFPSSIAGVVTKDGAWRSINNEFDIPVADEADLVFLGFAGRQPDTVRALFQEQEATPIQVSTTGSKSRARKKPSASAQEVPVPDGGSVAALTKELAFTQVANERMLMQLRRETARREDIQEISAHWQQMVQTLTKQLETERAAQVSRLASWDSRAVDLAKDLAREEAKQGQLKRDLELAHRQLAEAEYRLNAALGDLAEARGASILASTTLAEERQHTQALAERAREAEENAATTAARADSLAADLHASEQRAAEARAQADLLAAEVDASEARAAETKAFAEALADQLQSSEARAALSASQMDALAADLRDSSARAAALQEELAIATDRLATLDQAVRSADKRSDLAARRIEEMERAALDHEELEAKFAAQLAQAESVFKAQLAEAQTAARSAPSGLLTNVQDHTMLAFMRANGETIISAMLTLESARQLERADRWRRFLQRQVMRKRFAAVLRSPIARRFLRRHWFGRAATLYGSALFVAQDSPGLAQLVRAARTEQEEHSPHPLFDSAYYALRAGDVQRKKLPLCLHYLYSGDAEGRDPHALFNIRWYRDTYGAHLNGWRLTTLEHYIVRGAREGLSPHPLFDTQYYVMQSDASQEGGMTPLVHYLAKGFRQGLNPHPLFDTEWYLDKNPDIRRADMPPLLHFVLSGAREGRDPHPLFSVSYYLEQNPDVAAAGMNPLEHYLIQGWREGRKPSPDFDPRAYLNANPDVAAAGAEPLTHYLRQGNFERRVRIEPFDVSKFAAINSAELLSGTTPLEAWVRKGRPNLDESGAAPLDATALPPPAPSIDVGAPLFRTLADSARASEKDAYDWQAYVGLSTTIASADRQRIERYAPRPGDLVEIAESDVEHVAQTLRFKVEEQPDVTLLIPAYNHRKLTVECLASLARANSGVRFEVLVADDASTDGTAALLNAIPGVRVVSAPQNQGFLRNVNGAAAHARGRIVVLLNNDVQVTPGWLEPLVAALDEPDVGAVSPKLLFPNGRLQEAGGRFHADGSARMIGLFDDPDLPRFNYPRDVDYVSGACLALRLDIFCEIGGLDERFAPAYCEDADLCLQLRNRGLRIRYEPKSRVYHHLSITSNALPGDYKVRLARKNQQKLLEKWQETIASSHEVRTIALYLPQFHRVRENDAWWGPGFTEWTNVQRALPNFLGHYQPHRPAELGFYDLANPDIMDRQAELARSYGVHGFCYYYYSFSGRRILEMPLERMLATGKPDLPFCVCWANENWTRTWDGGDEEILLAQQYRHEDDVAIIDDLIRYMRSPNYIRVNGKPLLVLYRPLLLPNLKRTIETWRKACREQGIGEIYLTCMEVFDLARRGRNPSELGFDASIEFPPSGMSEPALLPGPQINPAFNGVVSDYRRIVQNYAQEPVPGFTRFRGVMPSWDATARRQDKSYVFHNATPGAFQAWLELAYEQTRDQNHGDERIVFVNAWNEWAEGAHLEPDQKFGRGWLEAVRNAQVAGSQLAHRKPQW